ncbi:MAG: hypothetical protein WC069_03645 [Candidatus Shapirobacteria bacterium]
MTTCTICRKEFGNCDTKVHEKKLLPGYRFKLDEKVTTQYYEASISPRLSEVREEGGIKVVDVAVVEYTG